MSEILLYTFKSFPYKETISKLFGNIFLFHKLNQDLKQFKNIYHQMKPDYVVGLARAQGKYSYFETKAINQFHRDKRLNNTGPKYYKLAYPRGGYQSIRVHYKATDTFCNWTMYKISELINGDNVKFLFIHMKKEDIQTLLEYMQSL